MRGLFLGARRLCSGYGLVGLRFRGRRVCGPGRLVGSPQLPAGVVPGAGSGVRSRSGSRGDGGAGGERRWGLEGLVSPSGRCVLPCGL